MVIKGVFMGKKRVLKIPKSVKVKCPKCGKNTLMEMPKENIYFFECKKCKNKAYTPQSQCCVLCAYGNSPCAPHLQREAIRRKLEVKWL